MWWTILIIVLILIIVTVLISISRDRKLDKDADRGNAFSAELKSVGTYAGGYPGFDQSMDSCFASRKGSELEFYRKLMMENPVLLFSIKVTSIKAVEAVDAYAAAKKLSSGKILLAGSFALEWERKDKNNTAFATINWEENEAAYTTLFCFEGSDALQQAHASRNELLKLINSSPAL